MSDSDTPVASLTRTDSLEESYSLPTAEKVIDNIDALAHPDRYPDSVYCSLAKPASTAPLAVRMEYAKMVMRLTNKADFRASESFNEKILLTQVLAHKVTKREVDEDTGEVHYIPLDRIVLLDNEGRTFEAVSAGLMQSVRMIFQLLGQPDTWTEPIPVTIRSIPVRGGEWHTFKLDIWEERAPKKSK